MRLGGLEISIFPAGKEAQFVKGPIAQVTLSARRYFLSSLPMALVGKSFSRYRPG